MRFATKPLGHALRKLLRPWVVFVESVRAIPKMSGREFLRGLVDFGFESIPLALAVAAIAGATVVLQTSLYVQKFGARTQLGWAAGYAIIWEFGPLFLGLVMGARVGARNAAEMAQLTIGGQIEGLRGISLNPMPLLIAPRICSMTLAVMLLAGLTFVVAIAVEAGSAFFALGIPLRIFLENFASTLRAEDLLGGLIKSGIFGIATASISTASGLAAQGGARGVGLAAARSVVFTSGAIFTLDLIVTPPLARWLS